MYFEQFPKTFYSLDDNKSVQLVTNIFLRVILSDEIKNNLTLYELYDIKEGETPEIIADQFYGDPKLHWVICHLNEIIDPRFDWPLSTKNLKSYCETKYDNIFGIHHYINSEGYIVNSTVPGATSVSNFQYEEQLNEKKRRIRLLKPEFIRNVVNDFKNIVSSV
jgi:hypothetical protein